MMQALIKIRKRFLDIFFLLIAGIVIVANYHLQPTDEFDWVDGGQAFLQALQSHRWADTYTGSLAGHPGITVFYLIALSRLLHQEPRLFLSVANLLLCYLSLKILTRWFSLKILIFSLIYWLASPYLFWNLYTTWADQLLIWTILLTAALWLRGLPKITGIFLGLALLTKVVAAFLLPVLIIINRNLRQFITVVVVAFLTFTILYPAMWVKPLETPFNRFRKSSQVETNLTPSSVPKLAFYPLKAVVFDLVIPLGGIIFLLGLYRRWSSSNQKLSFVGVAYLTTLTFASAFLIDRGNGPQAFFTSFHRYLSPAIPLFTLPVFAFLDKNGKLEAAFLFLLAFRLTYLYTF